MKHSIVFCLLADLIDMQKLLRIQNEIKCEKEVYKRPNCTLQVLPLTFIVC